MRAQACIARIASTTLVAVVATLGAGCASPLAAPLVAAPLIRAAQAPQALAAPVEDGSVYVLAEGGPLSSKSRLRSLWKRKASQACEGDYMVMSERDSQSRRGGVIGGRSYEGFVRCISPEGMRPE